MITEKVDCARGYWRKAQPKIKDDGKVETLQEVEDQMIISKNENGKYSHMGRQHRARYNQGLTTVQWMIQLKHEEGATDISAWQWMERLL
ncbi:hypothetical protein L208DRAFT_1242030 [Tricholoma matsutake]|nr:hypothetical protein L208DRAFT_1242030 [Tricholoma matsutake 945]